MEAVLQSAITIVIFLVILGSIVVLHELGHFITARVARITVHEFGIGFPPRAAVLGKRGDTTWTLNWLPIGGFVKLEGEDGDSDDPHSFGRAGLPKQLIVLVAGVTMNLFLAVAIFWSIAWFANPVAALDIGEVQAGSPAAVAGIVAGDRIIGMERVSFDYLDGPEGVIGSIKTNAGQTKTFTILHANGEKAQVTATLRTQSEIDAEHGALGIAKLGFTFTGDYFQRGPIDSFQVAVQRTVSAFSLILQGLGSLVVSLVSHPTQAPPVSGPVGIAVQVGDGFWQLGPIFTLYLAGILSANLALVNVLPFPPLDGGRMAILLVKRFAGSRLSGTAERLTYLVGFALIMGLLLWVTLFDIIRQVTGSGS